jgi:hypothetical protein
MLEIRRVSAEDTDALLEILGDPEVAYWLRPAGASGAFTRAECEEIIARKLAHWETHGFGMSLGFLGGRCAGRATVGYNLVDGRAELEIGWAVAPRDVGSRNRDRARSPRAGQRRRGGL